MSGGESARDYVTPANAPPRWQHLRDALLALGRAPEMGADAAMRQLLCASRRALDVARVSFWRVASDQQSMRCEYESTHDDVPSLSGAAITAERAPDYFRALESTLTLAAEDVYADERTAELIESYLRPSGIGALLDVAVRVSGDLVGVVCHEHVGGARAWTAEERLFVAAISAMAVRQFEHQQLIESETRRRQALRVDRLCGLPNRVALLERVREVLEAGAATPCALLVLDIDRFHRINHAHGSEVGDRVLMAVAQRLAALFSRNDLARLGNDQFVVLLPAGDIDHAVADIRSHLEGRRLLPERALSITFSIGMVPSLVAYDNPDAVLRDAMIAADAASRGQRGAVCVFDADRHAAAAARLRLEAELRQAVSRHEFVFHLQPILALPDGRLVGAEALLRWQHPRSGLLAPGAFLDSAEETELIGEIQAQLLPGLLQRLARWRDRPGMSAFQLHINASASQLASKGAAQQWLTRLRDAGLEPQAIQLEITENTLLDPGSEIEQQLRYLAQQGIALSMDDFGTGFASISHLASLPLTSMKIDRSFVQRMGGDARATNLVRVLIDMARELGLQVVAEGIETENQSSLLRLLGCEMGQGYLLGRPVNVDEFERKCWLYPAMAPGTA